MSDIEDMFYTTNATLARELGYKITEEEFDCFVSLLYKAGPQVFEDSVAVVKAKFFNTSETTPPAPANLHRYLCGVMWNKLKEVQGPGAYAA